MPLRPAAPAGGVLRFDEATACLQVNISGEVSKGGLPPDDVAPVVDAVAALPPESVRLRGLMAIPEPAADFAAQRGPHRTLRELLEALNASGLALHTLSMGMSADPEAAVAEGATMVRIGTAIFGLRLQRRRVEGPVRQPQGLRRVRADHGISAARAGNELPMLKTTVVAMSVALRSEIGFIGADGLLLRLLRISTRTADEHRQLQRS